MTVKKKRVNPFYVLLVVVGLAFALTACAYGVMAVKLLHASDYPLSASSPTTDASQAVRNDAAFMDFMNQNGERLMIIQLFLLALTTFAAIGTDHIWSGER